jgi:hypothetical protein
MATNWVPSPFFATNPLPLFRGEIPMTFFTQGHQAAQRASKSNSCTGQLVELKNLSEAMVSTVDSVAGGDCPMNRQ